MKTKEEIYSEYSDNPIKWMQDNNCATTKEVTLKLMEAYHEDKTRCSEFEIDFNGNVHTRLKFIEGKLSVTGAMNGYGDAIEIDKIKITELALPTPPKINADKV